MNALIEKFAQTSNPELGAGAPVLALISRLSPTRAEELAALWRKGYALEIIVRDWEIPEHKLSSDLRAKARTAEFLLEKLPAESFAGAWAPECFRSRSSPEILRAGQIIFKTLKPGGALMLSHLPQTTSSATSATLNNDDVEQTLKQCGLPYIHKAVLPQAAHSEPLEGQPTESLWLCRRL